ncbi:tRNA (adenosine(37)-N6)-dimethylallyltransferase MiaA [Enterococcus columbae]|uniref:tRNA dimethylallyltransferase n=1 Tax=Enterococcus columbae DSM 7374 = ATCC 51263 TaxID=1121865 RepID=S1NEN9_9ENTE|nr:tRNA (adenosine(37)-N6)-dimethylallyltransferase MiaA [Enterococcus columbae]EOT44840.1 tRNA dimethylallyltransferase [Enterococcus columbae DSM 7374 = ATCC 51263]EOW84133.1 tRNA dimethylallyltransferase [Enterococcus columbae DSM 7374 = ATCC 51263]OJG23324.1 tRNA dimethylallyltransferase [Enterococcus columbae DSM 7374 = ATCC 51263]
MKKVIVVAGPTAVGKTALSIELAQKYNGEVINGDSMQVYRGLDIGTAKITSEEKQGVPHHLLDIRSVDEGFSVADFKQLASECIDNIIHRGHLPIIVGGTGLYLQALLEDFQLGQADESAELSAKIRQEYQQYSQKHGKEALWQLLAQTDSLAAEKIHFNNERKVIRALEVWQLTNRSIFDPATKPQKRYDDFSIALTCAREVLYERINQRVLLMIEQGLVEEAKFILQQPTSQAAKGIGYKELLPYYKGESSLDEAIATIQQNSRRYAKRQLTWFRNRMAMHWYNLLQEPKQKQELFVAIDQWLNQ